MNNPLVTMFFTTCLVVVHNTAVFARNCTEFNTELEYQCTSIDRCDDSCQLDCQKVVARGYVIHGGEVRKQGNIIFGQGYLKELVAQCIKKPQVSETPQKISSEESYKPPNAFYKAFGQESLTRRMPSHEKMRKVLIPESIVSRILWFDDNEIVFHKAKTRRARRRQSAIAKRAKSRKAYAEKQFAKRKRSASKRRARRKVLLRRNARRKRTHANRSQKRVRKVWKKKRITRRRKTYKRKKRSFHKRYRARRRARRSSFKEAFGF